MLLLFDDNKIKIARKPGKNWKGYPAKCTGEGKRWKVNIWEGSRECKTGFVLFQPHLLGFSHIVWDFDIWLCFSHTFLSSHCDGRCSNFPWKNKIRDGADGKGTYTTVVCPHWHFSKSIWRNFFKSIPFPKLFLNYTLPKSAFWNSENLGFYKTMKTARNSIPISCNR